MPPKVNVKPSQLLAHLELHGIVKPRVPKPAKSGIPHINTVATISFTRRELEANDELRQKVEKVDAWCDALLKLASGGSGYKFSKRDFFLNAAIEVIDRLNNQGESEEETNG